MSRDLRTAKMVNELLRYLVFTGMVGSVVVAPSAVQVGDKALKFLDKRSRKLESKRILLYMRQKNLIDYQELEDGQLQIKVTESGQQRLKRVNFDEMRIKKQKRWDRKWRLVMFDVPESRKRARRALSSKLRELGFYQLQKSVWVHAYPCAVEVEITKQVFGIPDRDIIVGQISEFGQQAKLIQHFKLNA